MNKEIIPRWEYRLFDRDLSMIKDQLAGFTPRKEFDSNETYFLSPHNDNNFKLRQELLDIKVMLQSAQQGLELWTVLAKYELPLHINNLLIALKFWGLGQPPLSADKTALSQVLEDYLLPAGLQSFKVTKHRRLYTITDLRVDFTELQVQKNGHGQPQSFATFGFEHPHIDKVAKMRQEWGFNPTKNINYIAFLKGL